MSRKPLIALTLVLGVSTAYAVPRSEADRLYQAGQAAFLEGKMPEAREYWEKTLKEDPSHPDAKQAIQAVDAFRKKAPASLLRIMAENRREQTGHASPELEEARYERVSRETHEAWQRYKELSDERTKIMARRLAVLRAKTTHLPKARRAISVPAHPAGPTAAPAPPAAPDSRQEAELMYLRGLRQFQNRDLEGAKDSWERCLELDPKHADAPAGIERIRQMKK